MSNGIKMKDMAYSVIKNKILSNVFEPGEYLEEKMLCQLVGVSRTPIRESINQLESEGFVVTKPNKGIFVTTIDIRKSMELFEARYYLEPIVLELSWKYMQVENLKEFKKKIEVSLRNKDYMALNEIDYEFHNYIHEHCNNGFVLNMMNRLQDQFHRIRTLNYYKTKRIPGGAKEHIQIINYFLENNLSEAKELIRQHILNTKRYYYMTFLNE